MSKYITVRDMDKSLKSLRFLIATLKERLYFQEQKLEDYVVLYDYLISGGLCPYTKKQLLSNYDKFKFYIMPLKQRYGFIRLEEDVKLLTKNVDSLVDNAVFNKDVEPKNYKDKPHTNLDKETRHQFIGVGLGKVLEDFVQYVCAYKGCKVGIGQFLINKYLEEICKD